jgi:hypothetical protein
MPLPSNGQLTVVSSDGQVEFSMSYFRKRSPGQKNLQSGVWGWQSYASSKNSLVATVVPWKTVIRYRAWRSGDIAVILPHWLLAVGLLLLTFGVWVHWSRRFSIRTMLIITALVSVVLALTATAGD